MCIDTILYTNVIQLDIVPLCVCIHDDRFNGREKARVEEKVLVPECYVGVKYVFIRQNKAGNFQNDKFKIYL